jgi:uncharacterized protein YjbI with pentapeptide repeats
MTTVARRGFIQLLGGFAGTLPGNTGVCSPLVPRQHKRRISQRELEDAIERHAHWLEDDHRGARAAFGNCDLSGRDFLSGRTEIVDLRGSDFTEADLSAITGNQVSFHRASLQSARLSGSHLKLPIFCGATLRKALCKNVVWGWPSPSSFQPPSKIDGWDPKATFINTDLSITDFNDARVIGFFSGTRFSGSSLRGADLSHSQFAGARTFCETSFAGSDLTQARFNHASVNATYFRSAILKETDFSFATIGSKCTWPVGKDMMVLQSREA